MNGYDQWKTASPYDEYDDEHCAYCGRDLPDDVTGYSGADEDAIMDGFCDTECLRLGINGDIHPNYGDYLIEKEFGPVVESLIQQTEAAYDIAISKTKATRIEDILKHLPEGDFNWKAEEAGDIHVWRDGDKWCQSAYATDYIRENGKLRVEYRALDVDNFDWETTACWDEADGDTPESFHEIGLDLAMESNDFFKGHALYWLDCALTGNDPIGAFLGTGKGKDVRVGGRGWTEFCINAARSNLGYLKQIN